MTLSLPVFMPADVVSARFVAHTRVPLSDLTGRSQTAAISRRRQELMWCLRELTTATMGQIGAMLGGRTAATVDEGLDRIRHISSQFPSYVQDLAALRAAICKPEAALQTSSNDLRVTMAMGLLSDPALTDQDARTAALILLRSSAHGR